MFAPSVEKFGKNTIVCAMSQYNYRAYLIKVETQLDRKILNIF